MKILIIEDEPATAKRLEKMLVSLDAGIIVENIIDTVEESIHYFQRQQKPDLVFMDIHLADGNSFEIFEKVNIKCPVIFTTAYDQYAIQAFKVNSIDYLLKPIKKEELEKSLKKFKEIAPVSGTNIYEIKQILELLEQKKPAEIKRLLVKIGARITAVSIDEVAYFYIEDKIVYAVLFNAKKYPVDFSLDQLENELNSQIFFRINRGFIICFEAIRSMTTYSKSRIKIELEPTVVESIVSSTDRTSNFKVWLKEK